MPIGPLPLTVWSTDQQHRHLLGAMQHLRTLLRPTESEPTFYQDPQVIWMHVNIQEAPYLLFPKDYTQLYKIIVKTFMMQRSWNIKLHEATKQYKTLTISKFTS